MVSAACNLDAQQLSPAARAEPVSSGAASSAAGPALVLRDATVIDVTSGRLRRRQTVVVIGNRIRTIGPAGKVRLPSAARIVDARGKYLMPGLWEMHIHVNGEPQIAYNLMIATGVTGMREMGTAVSLADQQRQRDEIMTGTRVGPRLLVTGGLVEIGDSSGTKDKILIRTPADARRVVDSLKAAEADHIKLHADDMPRDVFFALAAEARRVRLRMAGHLPGSVTAEEAADSGLRGIEHQAGMTGVCWTQWWGNAPPASDSASFGKCSALAARLRRNGTWMSLSGGLPPRRVTGEMLRARAQYWPRKFWPDTADFSGMDRIPPNYVPDDMNGLAQRSGMPLIIVGHIATPNVGANLPGFSVHDAVAFAVQKGLTPLTALQAVTLNPAKYLDGTDSLGTVAAGKLADLVLLDANPLEDIYNTLKIRAVIANGRYFDRAALDALLVRNGTAE